MSALSQFRISGDASPARVRGAGLLDLLAATVVAMIVVPQPIVRATLIGPEASALGIVLFVATLLIAILVVLAIYLAFSAVTWGRSPAMYLLDLGLESETKPTLGEALAWAAGWALGALPALVGVRAAYHPETGWPARFSGMPTRATTGIS